MQPSFALRAVPFHTVFYSVLLLLHGSGHAQISSPSSADSPPTIRVSSQFVMLDALIENKQAGSLPGNLQLTDFRLSEDGVPTKSLTSARTGCHSRWSSSLISLRPYDPR